MITLDDFTPVIDGLPQLHHDPIGPSLSVPVLVQRSFGGYSIALLSQWDEEDPPKWLQDGPDAYDITDSVAAWTYLPPVQK